MVIKYPPRLLLFLLTPTVMQVAFSMQCSTTPPWRSHVQDHRLISRHIIDRFLWPIANNDTRCRLASSTMMGPLLFFPSLMITSTCTFKKRKRKRINNDLEIEGIQGPKQTDQRRGSHRPTSLTTSKHMKSP